MKYNLLLSEKNGGGRQGTIIEADDFNAARLVAREKLAEWIDGGSYDVGRTCVTANWTIESESGVFLVGEEKVEIPPIVI